MGISDSIASMAKNQRDMQIEMAMKQRQAQLAMQQAIGKERFKYYSALYGLAWIGLPLGAMKKKNPATLIPLFPMTFAWLFQYDMFYGTLLVRASREAARTIKEEPECFYLPEGNGIVERSKYNEIIGKPANYSSKINPNDHVFTTL